MYPTRRSKKTRSKRKNKTRVRRGGEYSIQEVENAFSRPEKEIDVRTLDGTIYRVKGKVPGVIRRKLSRELGQNVWIEKIPKNGSNRLLPVYNLNELNTNSMYTVKIPPFNGTFPLHKLVKKRAQYNGPADELDYKIRRALASGANPNVKNKNGHTVYDLARGHKQLERILGSNWESTWGSNNAIERSYINRDSYNGY